MYLGSKAAADLQICAAPGTVAARERAPAPAGADGEGDVQREREAARLPVLGLAGVPLASCHDQRFPAEDETAWYLDLDLARLIVPLTTPPEPHWEDGDVRQRLLPCSAPETTSGGKHPGACEPGP